MRACPVLRYLLIALVLAICMSCALPALAEGTAEPPEPSLAPEAATEPAEAGRPVRGFIADALQEAGLSPAAEPLQAGITLSSNELLEAGDCQAAVYLQNHSGGVLSDVTLYDAEGNALWGPHELDPNESYTWRGSVTITDDMLVSGVYACRATYIVAKGDALERQREKKLSCAINQASARPDLEFSRAQSMTYAQPGQGVTLTYTVKNTGNVPLVNVAISDSLFGPIETIARLELDEKKTVTRRITLGQAEVVSVPSVRYSGEADDTVYTKDISPTSIRIAQPSLEVSLESDATLVKSGDTVKLRCKLSNNGNVGYRKIQLSDQTLGDLGFVDDLKPGQDSVYTKTVSIKARTTYKFTITAQDTTGASVTVVTNSLTVDTLSETEAQPLTIAAQADKTSIDDGETVEFTLTLSNNGVEDITDIEVSERSNGSVGHVELLAAGESTDLTVSYTPAGSQVFTFAATIAQPDGARREVLADAITVSLALPEPTVVPTAEFEPSPAPTLSPAAARAYSVLLSRILTYVTAAAICILVVLLVVNSAIRARDRDLRRKARKRREHTGHQSGSASSDDDDVTIYHKPARRIEVRPAEPVTHETGDGAKSHDEQSNKTASGGAAD